MKQRYGLLKRPWGVWYLKDKVAEQDASAVVVSQTWAEVHRVNSRVRDALKAKGLLGASDVTIEVLDKLDLTNAQKRDERFYPKDAVVVFNQKIRQAEPGAKGKLAGIVKSGLLVDVGGRFVTVSNKMLDRVSGCLPRECPISIGDRLHLKANRKLASPTMNSSQRKRFVRMVESNSPMAASWIRAFANSSPDTPSRPTAHKARRWITSCSPTRPSRRQQMPSNGM